MKNLCLFFLCAALYQKDILFRKRFLKWLHSQLHVRNLFLNKISFQYISTALVYWDHLERRLLKILKPGVHGQKYQGVIWASLDGQLIPTIPLFSDFIFLGSKITTDGDYNHEIKRCFLLGRKAMANLDSVLKSRDILPTKIHLVKAMVFPVVMYGCESGP